MPKLTGSRLTDHLTSAVLHKEVLMFSQSILKDGGRLLIKIMQGPADKKLQQWFEAVFEECQLVRPAASRHDSKEIFLLCENYGQPKDELAKKYLELFKKAKELDGEDNNPEA